MKIILRIIAILLVASVVAGGFSLAVNNTSSTTAGSSSPALTNSDGQSFQLMERPEGGDGEGSSIAGGLAGVLGTLAKLTGISIFVLLVQKIYSQLGTRKLQSAARLWRI